MMGVRLSIIVPVYKVRDYVGQCLRSILDGGADEAMYELIVVNDGTPDDSMSVVREVVEGHSNVTVIAQENQGLSAARMAGLSTAEGEYVWFVDSDDWLEVGAVETILRMISNKPGYDVYAMPLLWATPQCARPDFTLSEEQTFTGRNLLRTAYPLWAIQRYIMKRNLFERSSVFFPKGLIHEDEYFYRVLLYHAGRVLLLASSVYYYRQRPDSIMGAKSVRSLYDQVSIYRLLESFLDREVEPVDKRWFQTDICNFLLACYKDSFKMKTGDAVLFRKKHRMFLLSRGLLCRGYSLKEKVWIIRLLFFTPKKYRHDPS